jgi:SAM-dependent methyltransferase
MTFSVAAEAYDRFMGRYSRLLAPQMADLAGVRDGQRVLDVGCGPGALIAELVPRVGAANVTAVDPSEPFVNAARARYPDVDVRRASVESLPFADRAFDVSFAQLVVHFMSDPVRGLAEMARVTRRDGVVAACVWDHGTRRGPLSVFWQAARQIDPDVDDESRLPGVREGHLAELFGDAGLRHVEAAALSVSLEHATFEEWWEPFTLGVGPAGACIALLDRASMGGARARVDRVAAAGGTLAPSSRSGSDRSRCRRSSRRGTSSHGAPCPPGRRPLTKTGAAWPEDAAAASETSRDSQSVRTFTRASIVHMG